MPFTKQEYRDAIDNHLDLLMRDMQAVCKSDDKRIAGVFTYVIYKMLLRFFSGKYCNRSQAVGCLDLALDEWKIRIHRPKECEAREQNGDIPITEEVI